MKARATLRGFRSLFLASPPMQNPSTYSMLIRDRSHVAHKRFNWLPSGTTLVETRTSNPIASRAGTRLHSSVGIMRCLLTAHDTQESGPVPPQGPSLRQKSRSPQLFCKRLPGQAFVLGEMARYFEHSSSGVRRFDQMNSEWRPLVLGIRDGQQFKRNSPEIENTVTSWHQEERDVCLILSRRIGEQVSIRRMSRKHRAEPARRLRDACDALVSSNELHSSFSVPNAASDLEVTADLQRRTISCSMKLSSPLDKQRASARINWLRRQLRDVDGDDIQVRAFWPGRALPTQAPLSEVKLDSKCLENESPGMVPTGFEVVTIRDIAGRFSGRRTFIEDLENMIPEFYDEVGQHLRPWAPPPPSIDKEDPIEEGDADYSGQEAVADCSSPAAIDDSDTSLGRGNTDSSPAGEE